MARRQRSQRRTNLTSQTSSSSSSYPAPLRNPFEPLRILSDDQVADIHQTAIRYLADHGINVLFDEARNFFESQGGAVVGDDLMVRLDPDAITESLRSAPSQFQLHAPNPARDVPIGGNSLALLPVGGPPFVSDLETGRRPGTLADQENFLRLTQTYDVLAATGPCVEPSDIALNVRHLVSGTATMTLTDKVPFIFARGRRRVQDLFELVKIRHELPEGPGSDAVLAERPRCWTKHQHQLAPTVGRADVDGDHRLCPSDAAMHHDAVHAVRSDGSRHAGWFPCGPAHGSSGRRDLGSTGSAGRPCGLRRLYLKR